MNGEAYEGAEIDVTEPVTIVVTAEDGETTETYTLTVTATAPSADNTVKVTVDEAEAVAGEEGALTAEAADPASITLALELPAGATATVNGEAYTEALTEFDATEAVKIVVTAENGETAEYTLTVTKKSDEEPTPAPITKDDVSDNLPSWAEEQILTVLNKDIMSSTDPNSDKIVFSPSMTMTREQFAVIVCKLYGVDYNTFEVVN